MSSAPFPSFSSRLLVILFAGAMAIALTGGPVLAMQMCRADADPSSGAAAVTEHSCCSASNHDSAAAQTGDTPEPTTGHCTPECMAVCCAVAAPAAAPEMLGKSIDLSTSNHSFVHIPISAGPADPQIPPPRI